MSSEMIERTAHLQGYLRRLDHILEIMGTRDLRAYDVNASLNLLASSIQELAFMVEDQDKELRRLWAELEEPVRDLETQVDDLTDYVNDKLAEK